MKEREKDVITWLKSTNKIKDVQFRQEFRVNVLLMLPLFHGMRVRFTSTGRTCRSLQACLGNCSRLCLEFPWRDADNRLEVGAGGGAEPSQEEIKY